MSKKREYYLVDGYNLIHAWPELKTDDFSAARDRLTHILIEYGAYEKLDITLVFDAGSTDEEEHAEESLRDAGSGDAGGVPERLRVRVRQLPGQHDGLQLQQGTYPELQVRVDGVLDEHRLIDTLQGSFIAPLSELNNICVKNTLAMSLFHLSEVR